MASAKAKIDCSICKVTFDEDHGVWVCLECTEKLTNAIHQASMSPKPVLQSKAHSAHSVMHQRRSSLPEKESIAMTLFLELTNNGNKRRFKYKPSDLHRNISLNVLQKHLLRRFSHDLDIKHLNIASQAAFEVNDKRYAHQFIIFETLHDLFDGAKIKIMVQKYYYEKYKTDAKTTAANVPNATAISSRRRSKSAELTKFVGMINDDNKFNDPQSASYHKHKLKIKTQIPSKIREKAHGTDVISPVFRHKLRDTSYDEAVYGSNDDDNEFAHECIIIDNGSGLMKCGFGGLSDNSAPHAPHIVFPTTYMQQHHNVAIGEAAIEMSNNSQLPVMRPINRGFITNWNEMEYIWSDILNNKLSKLYGAHDYAVSDHSVLMTERYESPYADREKLVQIMFESFSIPSLYLAHSACLSIYGTGRTKGVVLDIGDGITSIVAMFDKVNVSHNRVIEFGGSDLTQNIMKQYHINNYYEANKIKEAHFSVPYDRSDLLFADINRTVYKLPDGKQIQLGKERMITPRHLLFDANEKYDGIHVSQLVANCIESNDKNTQNVLWRNIVLSGGTTMMNGFAEKFAKEIKHLTPVKTQVLAGRQRRYLAWLGAVVMSSISTFKNISVSRQMYLEHGPRVVRDLKL